VLEPPKGETNETNHRAEPILGKLFSFLSFRLIYYALGLVSDLFACRRVVFIPSTPTLLHSGLKKAQLSSCFLTTVNDDLNHIFKSYQDSANLLKYSGGVANDWSNIRATGSLIGKFFVCSFKNENLKKRKKRLSN